MAKTVPNFGQIANAAKYGWKWISEMRLFVRITIGNGIHQVEIQPPTFILDSGKPQCTIIDWRMQEGVVDLLPALTKYLGRSKPHTFFVNDDGIEITPVVATIAPGMYERGQDIKISSEDSDARKLSSQEKDK